MRKLVNGNRHAVYSFVESGLSPIDVHKESKKSGLMSVASTGELVLDHPAIRETDGSQIHIPLDLKTWLPFAAKVYHISPDPSDYVIVPVIVMPSDLPNRNGVGFPLTELIKWDPEVGRQSYKTWKGMPTYSEHQNDDYTKARGVIADAMMRKLHGFNQGRIWKVLLLLTFDRSKYPDVAHRILTGETNSYSMGAWVSSYQCSYCNAEVGKCSHIRPNQTGVISNINGELVYRKAIGIRGFECSEVATPAYISAISDQVSSWG